MRVFASCLAATLCAACGHATAPNSASHGPPSASATVTTVNPSNVMRARTPLPPDYELSALPTDATPTALWGLGASPNSAPEDCAALAVPSAPGAQLAGWSASGSGGIVYVVVGPANDGRGPVDAADCVPWTMSTDHADAVIAFSDAPVIAAATTDAMTADVTSKVEGGSETRSRAETLVAHLDGFVAYVVVVTDPGASGPPLAPGFSARLLTETVTAIRS